MENRKSVEIYFTKPLNHPFPIIAWLIMLFTWSGWSHATYNFPTLSKIFHVRFNVIEWMGISKFLEKNTVVEKISINMPEHLYHKLIELCRAQPEKQKGYNLQLIGIGIVMPLKWLGFNKVPNPVSKLLGLNSVVCSEYIAKTLMNIGLRLDFDKYSLDTLSEKDLYNILSKNVGNLVVNVDNRPEKFVITRL